MNPQHPYNADRAVNNLVPSNFVFLDNHLYDKFLLPDCAGSYIIVQLLIRVQAYATHLTHTILTQRPLRLGNTNMVMFPEPKASVGMLTDFERRSTQHHLELVIAQLDVTTERAEPSTGGHCTRRPDRTFELLQGCGSTITINLYAVQQLNEALAAGNQVAQEYWTYAIVATMSHEIAHALANAVLPEGFETYMGTPTYTTELGFEFEHRLFGGHIQLMTGAGRTFSPLGALDGLVVQKQWPSLDTIAVYNTRNSRLGGGTQRILYRPDIPRQYIAWSVPFDYITRMFQDDFWRNLKPDEPNPLHPPRSTGFLWYSRYDVAAGLPAEGVVAMKPDVYPQAYDHVPSGFILEADGYVRPVKQEALE